MPPAKKRKIAEESKVQNGAPVDETAVSKSQTSPHINKDSDSGPSGGSQPDLTSVDKNQERKERFKALQARAVSLLCPTNLSSLVLIPRSKSPLRKISKKQPQSHNDWPQTPTFCPHSLGNRHLHHTTYSKPTLLQPEKILSENEHGTGL